jgi:hypothetical protein
MAADLREIQVHFTASPEKSQSVGILASQGQRHFFEYSPSWLEAKLELSPEQQDELSEKILDATRLEEIHAWLKSIRGN